MIFRYFKKIYFNHFTLMLVSDSDQDHMPKKGLIYTVFAPKQHAKL